MFGPLNAHGSFNIELQRKRIALYDSLKNASVDYSSVSLLLHLDGLNAGVVFTDNSRSEHVFSPSSGAATSTAASKFGGASLYCDGSSDFISTPGSSDFVFGTGDFTVECFVNTTQTGERYFIDHYSGSSGTWQLGMISNKLTVYTTPTGRMFTGTTTINDGTWHHLAYARKNGVAKAFVDGITNASYADATNYLFMTSVLGIGAQVAVRNTSYDFNGYIDEVRITKGLARYTADFTPPVAAFPNP